MPLKLTNGINQLSEPAPGNRSTQIVTSMTDNPNFAKPSPPAKNVDAIVAAYLFALS